MPFTSLAPANKNRLLCGPCLSFSRRLLLALGALLVASPLCYGTTTMTNTRAEISFMATLWEADSLQVSPLINAQYPQFSTVWQYIFPHGNLAADGDIHCDMAVDSSGYGSTNNNIGESPLIVEVINATIAQAANLQALTGTRVKPKGIFRLYTEHPGERHFELHPVTEIFNWNGATFVLSNNYRTNIDFVDDATTHLDSTLTNLLNGSQTITAAVSPDNVHVVFTYPSPSVNYVQYDGFTVSGFTNDAVSQYFLFRPNLVPQAVVRCRIVTNTVSAGVASLLISNQPVTVNALTRTDMLAVSNRIASLTANQGTTFARPIELITLGITNSGPPFISAQPRDQTVAPGQNATFTVVATGASPLYYQWRSNTTAISGATTNSYSRTNITLSDNVNYSVVVSNQLGSVTSTDAVLVVIAPPSITVQPQNQAVFAGQSATLSVTAGGPAPYGYQWRFNGNAVPGATSNSFVIGFAQATDRGTYSVLVTNAYGSIPSSNAVLSVLPIGNWGDNSFGQMDAPADLTNVVAVAAGAWHSLALKRDGMVAAWGNNASGQCAVPSALSNAVAIAAGSYHSLAIKASLTVAGWGANDYGQITVPAGLVKVIGVAAGTWHSLALRADGTVVAWGDNSSGQTNVPPGLTNVVAVAASGNHSLALKADGTVAAWGENTDAGGIFVGQSAVPAGTTNVVAIAAGEYHSLAVKGDGTVICWGDNSQSQCTVPPGIGGVVAVAGGGAHSLALRANGSVEAWGANWNGQLNRPPNLTNALAVAAGGYHSLLLLDAGDLAAPRLFDPAWNGSRFTVLLQTFSRSSYVLEFKKSLLDANWTALPALNGNGALRMPADPGAADRQRFYRVRLKPVP